MDLLCLRFEFFFLRIIYKDIAWHDLEISESLVIGLEVFFSGDFTSRSLESFFKSRSRILKPKSRSLKSHSYNKLVFRTAWISVVRL